MIDQLLKYFKLDAIIGLDAETFFSKEYTLKTMATTEYIMDTRFKLHCWAVQRHDGGFATVVTPAELQQQLPLLNRYQRVGVLCHHAQFDGLILGQHCDFQPAMFFDTLSM